MDFRPADAVAHFYEFVIPKAERIPGQRRWRVHSFTRRGHRFIWLVANFGGQFNRSHVFRFFGVRGGTPPQRLIDTLIESGLAEGVTEGKAVRYHLRCKAPYARIGDPDSVFRQQLSSTKTAHIRLAALDYVIDHIEDNYLVTTKHKRDHFLALGVPEESLPAKRIGNPHKVGGVVVPFADKLPISIHKDGEILFTYVDTADLSIRDFDTHLARYDALFRALTTPWSLTLVVTDPHKVTGYADLFRRRFTVEPEGNAPDPTLTRYMELRKAVDAKEFGRIGQAGMNEHMRLRKTFDTPANRRLYVEWLQGKPLPAVWQQPKAPCSLRFYSAPTFCKPRKSSLSKPPSTRVFTPNPTLTDQQLRPGNETETGTEWGWERPPVYRSLRDSGSLPSPPLPHKGHGRPTTFKLVDVPLRERLDVGHLQPGQHPDDLPTQLQDQLTQFTIVFRESKDDVVEGALRKLFHDDEQDFTQWLATNAHLNRPTSRRRARCSTRGSVVADV
jgi:hypothetical protein